MPAQLTGEKQYIHAQSLLTLAPSRTAEALSGVAELNEKQFEEFVLLADSNHVVVRALQPLANATSDKSQQLNTWAQAKLDLEKCRIQNALRHLHRICAELDAQGCPVTVIKTLEHWPDLGSDLDLYTTASDDRVCHVMTSRFKARIEPRSWGDRLAHKWNFAVPGLPEAVEIHVQRLGQTGEHTAMARRFVTRQQSRTIDGLMFPVPAPEESIIVATLQRMYRHFYFRVCDIVNTARVVESGVVDFAELKRGADLGGIWKGVCTYLKIVSDYTEKYRGRGIDLPHDVVSTAAFGGDKVYVQARFIRVPIMPQGAALYTEQVTRTALRGDVPATFRLGLLPYLASAAAISYKLTGSDKGIW
ncbi:MAG TPA: hypothetical protein VMU24_04130 [Candidatus Acidoferrales bacterium]|nr:hypothetical protein [Candidatus Acidoferrales bacterium]